MHHITDYAVDDLKNWMYAYFIKQDEINRTHSDKYMAAAFSLLFFTITREDFVQAMLLAGFRAEKIGEVYCFNIADNSPALAKLDSMFI